MNGQTVTAERVIAPPASERARHPAKDLLLAAATLWWREIRGFYRQRSRVLGGLLTPLLFWFVLGSGFGRSIDASTGTRAGYLEFFFPGMLALVVLFTSIFSNISVIEDRREGFLLSVMVAPVPRSVVVIGKVFGAATIGALQGVVLLPLALLLHLPLSLSQLPALLGTIGLLSFSLTGLGFFFAWWLNSVQGFHSVMNVLLMPMWLLSGAVFPVEGASAWIRWIMLANPLSYGVTLLRHVFYSAGSAYEPSATVCWLVMVAFSIATLVASFLLVSRRTAKNLV
jgi:ABC-2 type transport system permease protein